jgi:alanyl-tRNA synthetase
MKNIKHQIRDQIYWQIRYQIFDIKFFEQIKKQIYYKVEDEVNDWIRYQISNQIWHQTGSKIKSWKILLT